MALKSMGLEDLNLLEGHLKGNLSTPCRANLSPWGPQERGLVTKCEEQRLSNPINPANNKNEEWSNPGAWTHQR